MIRSLFVLVGLLSLVCHASANNVDLGDLSSSSSIVRKLKGYDNSTSSYSHPFFSTRKWTPGYVSATLADALADVLRISANAKAELLTKEKNFTQVLPTPTQSPAPIKSKSKDFAYTSIRLNAQASAPEILPMSFFPSPPPMPMPMPVPMPVPVPVSVLTPPPPSALLESVPAASPVTASGARTSPFVTTETNPTTSGVHLDIPNPTYVHYTPPIPENQPASMDQLSSKLAELQAQLIELEAQKRALISAKTNMTIAKNTSRRRLLDSGAPGWDVGTLFNKKLQEMETETALLQQLLSAQSSAAQSSLHASLSATAPFDRVDNSLHSFVTSQENTSKDHFQSSISSIQTALGDLQDRLGGVMDGAAAGRQSWLKNGIDEKRKHGFW